MLIVQARGARLLGQTLARNHSCRLITSMSQQGSYSTSSGNVDAFLRDGQEESRGKRAEIITQLRRLESGNNPYEWPRPALTVDAILITKQSPSQVLLIQRKQDPFGGSWALPGGFVDEMEPLHTAAARELLEETSVDISKIGGSLTQIGSFGDPGRDPRGWTVGVGYATLVDSTELGVKAADDAVAAQWYNIDDLPALAFDHKLILKTAFERMATEPEAAASPGLKEALKQAATKLTPPWHATQS